MVDCVMTGATPDECWPLIRDFHYSKRMPSSISHCFAWRKSGGLFGDTGEPLAVIIYGYPVNRNWPQDAIELLRMARTNELDKPLSGFISWSVKWLKANTNHPFILSYADTNQNHHGGIYQASGFSYVYSSKDGENIGFTDDNGEYIHGRTCYSRFGSSALDHIKRLKPNWKPVYAKPKNLYIRPLRQKLPTILRKMDWKELPYPKPDNAARPLDKAVPTVTSQVQPLGAAPVFIQQKQEVNK